MEKLNNRTAPWTWKRFKDTLKASFAPPDRPGEAPTLLITERQGSWIANKFIADFKINASRSGLKEDLSLIKWFSAGLNPWLAKKIRELEKVPSTIQDWYGWASRLNLNFRRGKAVEAWHGRNVGKKQGLKFTKNPFWLDTNYPDPNAMDTSRLSTKEQEDHIRQGRCFVCHEQGHVAWACNKRAESSRPTKLEQKKIMNTADAHAHLRSIYNDLSDTEKQGLYIQTPRRRGFLIKRTVLAAAPTMHSISLSPVIVVENERSFIIPL